LKNNTEIKDMAVTLSSLYGCRKYDTRSLYICSEGEKNIGMVIKTVYNNDYSATANITIPCSGAASPSMPICELDKSISANGEVRLTQGEKITYSVKVNGQLMSND